MVPRKGSSSDRGSAGLGPSEVERSIDAGTDRTEAYGSSGGAGSYAQGGGPAYQRIPLDPDRPGDRQARSLHADGDEDRQGIRRASGGVGGGVASRTIPTVAPISRIPGATLCANLALTEFSEVQLRDGERRSVRRVMSSSCSQPSPTKE